MKLYSTVTVRINECCGDYLKSYLFNGEQRPEPGQYAPAKAQAVPAKEKLGGGFPAKFFGTRTLRHVFGFRKNF